jgi:hypothetical protein
MKLYLAGPMSGIEDFNYPQFKAVAAWLRDPNGYEVLNPQEIDELHPKKVCGEGDSSAEAIQNCPECSPRDWSWYMRIALGMVLESEAIALLPGWEKSRGARRELDISLDLGNKIFVVKVTKFSDGDFYGLEQLCS